MIILVGFGAWVLCAAVCVAFWAFICRGAQLEDRLLVEHADALCEEGAIARHALPAAAADGFGPRSALDDVIRTAEQAGT